MTYQDFFIEWGNEEDHIIAISSGSTGTAKNICLPKEFLKQSALRTIRFFGITSDSRLHSCISPEYIGGKMMAVRASLSNCHLSWETPSNMPMQNISKKENIQLVAVVPSQMEYIVTHQEELPHVSYFLIGGGPIGKSLKKKIVSSGLCAYESYGMTETASHIGLRKIIEEDSPFTTLEGIHVSLNKEGCLVIHFEDGYSVATNDLAILKSSTEFYINGRRDHIIISGGKKLNPISVEKILENEFSFQFIVTGFPDDKWGERIVMIVEGEEENEQTKKIIETCRKYLERWQTPKEVIYVKELPRTSNGKIKRIKNPSGLCSVHSSTHRDDA